MRLELKVVAIPVVLNIPTLSMGNRVKVVVGYQVTTLVFWKV